MEVKVANSKSLSMKNLFAFSTWKYNPITSILFEQLIKHRAKNLELLIFTSTTGRSGTKTLAKVFNSIDGCVAYHEPQPIMYGARLVNRPDFDDPYSKFIYKYIKSVNIKRFIYGARYYVEGSHLFIKSFHDYAINEFKGRIKVLHLYRDPVKVANSIFSLSGPKGLSNCPGKEEGNDWWLDYHCENNKIQITDLLENDDNFKHDFYKCLWYWYEIEARTEYWRSYYKDIQFVDYRTEDLNDPDKLFVLLDKLGIPFSRDKIVEISKTRVNLKKADKTKAPLEQEIADEMHDMFRKKLEDLGYDIPGYKYDER